MDIDINNFKNLQRLLAKEYKDQAVCNITKQNFDKNYGFAYLKKDNENDIIEGMVSSFEKSAYFQFIKKNNKDISFDMIKPNKFVLKEDFGMIENLSIEVILKMLKRLKTQERQKNKEGLGNKKKSFGGGGVGKKGFYLINYDKNESSQGDIENFELAVSSGNMSEEFANKAIDKSLSIRLFDRENFLNK